MNKALASSVVLVGLLVLAGCASSESLGENDAPTPSVVEDTNPNDSLTLIESLQVSTTPVIEPGIYKVCDGTTLLYFSYGPTAGTRSKTYYSMSSPSAVANSPECRFSEE